MSFELRTERLLLREFVPDDAAALYRLRSDPEIMRWTGEEPASSVEAVRADIEAYPDYREHGFGRWAVEFEGGVVGFCGLKLLPERASVDIGYRFFPEHWGKGLATESGAACLRAGFERFGLERIEALVLPPNLGSIRVAEKLGMKRGADEVAYGLEVVVYEALKRDFPPNS